MDNPIDKQYMFCPTINIQISEKEKENKGFSLSYF